MDSGFNLTILIGRLVEKLNSEKYAMIQWHTNARNITTNYKVKVDLTLPKLSATNVVTWKFHVDDSAKGRYDMTLGRYLFTEFGLILKFSEKVIAHIL